MVGIIKRIVPPASIKIARLSADVPLMTFPVLLACGPDGTMLLLLGGAGAVALACVGSMIAGIVCLFTPRRTMGLWLVSVPAAVIAVFVAWLRTQ